MTEKERYDRLHQSLQKNGRLINVNELLGHATSQWPNNTIVMCGDDKITYYNLYQRAIKFSYLLKDKGVKSGDRIIIFYENSIEFYIAYFGIWLANAIVAPLNVNLQEAELLHIIDDAKPAVLIISPTLIKKIKSRPLDTFAPIISSIDKESIIQEDTTFQPEERNIDEIAALLYTSGTTGFPKGVMLSSRNIIINTIQGIARFEVSPKDKVFCPLPLFHSLPQNICVWANTLVGSTAIIAPKIDRPALLKGFSHKPTLVVCVPALYGLFSLMKTIDIGRVRYFIAGGDALSDKIRAAFGLVYRRKLGNGYGLTESSPFISVDVADYLQPTNTVGRPFIGIKCRFTNENGEEVPSGQVGTLWIKGDNVMLGYYNAQQATETVLKDGWLNTGDLAYLDSNGKIVIAGRERDLIINKGVKIYPQEIENLLLTDSSVLQAAVVGLKENDEEIPIAFVATRDKDPEKLIRSLEQLCRRNLAFYKVPRRFIIKRDLPLTSTGKVDKKVLKKELEQK